MDSKILQKWLESGHIPHSLLFIGKRAEQEALAFAEQLVEGKTPDLYLFRPEGKLGLHSIESIRMLREEVYLPPFQAKQKVFVIFAADRMLPPSANALLKTFEEPPSTSTILLVTSHPEKLLLTVRSRCQSVVFQDNESKSEKFLPILTPLLKCLPEILGSQILDEVEKLANLIESGCSVELREVKGESAYLKHVREKAGEGKEALSLEEETETLFITILSWYRDLHAAHLNLPLLEPTWNQEVHYRADRGAFPCLDAVQKKIDRAKESLSRSLPLKTVLESLFLSLKSV